jgi:hypothetical protein
VPKPGPASSPKAGHRPPRRHMGKDKKTVSEWIDANGMPCTSTMIAASIEPAVLHLHERSATDHARSLRSISRCLSAPVIHGLSRPKHFAIHGDSCSRHWRICAAGEYGTRPSKVVGNVWCRGSSATRVVVHSQPLATRGSPQAICFFRVSRKSPLSAGSNP